jgi:broad specificity phosphatase PhoE
MSLESEKVKLEEEITEWDHGMYEGWLGSEIRASRKERGLDKDGEWSIWSDGCEEGE